MKRRYQISIIFELPDTDDAHKDNIARYIEEQCYHMVREYTKDTFEDMVWIMDKNNKCIGSL